MNLLETKQLAKHFGGLKALDQFDMQLQEGMIFGVIGPNGAGKTTLFNCVTGLGTATRGEVLFCGIDITRKKPHRITPLGVARTFQNIRLFGEMSAIENVIVGMHCRTKSGTLGAILRTPKVRAEERRSADDAMRLLDFVGLAPHANEWARNLSYGDQRKLEIARALGAKPKLVLLDEPAAGMNPHETELLIQLIRKIRDSAVTVLLIEHDMKVVMGISDRVAVLDYGVKIAEGTTKEVQANPKVIEAYLGKDEDYV